MDKLFDETLACEDFACRNIGYGSIEFYRETEYGNEMLLDESLLSDMSEAVKRDLSEDSKPTPTETHWFFYGKTIARDMLEDSVRPNVMIRERQGVYLVHCNISDHDFAVGIDTVVAFQADLEKRLMG